MGQSNVLVVQITRNRLLCCCYWRIIAHLQHGVCSNPSVFYDKTMKRHERSHQAHWILGLVYHLYCISGM
ncbi:hypothetical protein XELAEV_18016832mg [Xenopus laevis]|uniref:Uncharacterized protein n=1 Tax=Xenopus laevis TaxID=8355 RepID=A0A974DCJ8_XENLA|nr:hypothetical protein XELAEV_18016832mg [Xenopus laevis]